MESTEETVKVTEIINDAKIGMLATIGNNGAIAIRPLVVQQVLDDGDLWFITDAEASLVAEVKGNDTVNVSFSGKDAWVSVSGTAEVVEDSAKSRELWNPVVDAWFPDGPDTPGLVLLHVHADSAQYWDSPGKVATVLEFAKAKVTGQRVDPGESHTTEL